MALPQTRSGFAQQSGNIDGTLDRDRYAMQQAQRLPGDNFVIRELCVSKCAFRIHADKCIELWIETFYLEKMCLNKFHCGNLPVTNPRGHLPRRQSC